MILIVIPAVIHKLQANIAGVIQMMTNDYCMKCLCNYDDNEHIIPVFEEEINEDTRTFAHCPECGHEWEL